MQRIQISAVAKTLFSHLFINRCLTALCASSLCVSSLLCTSSGAAPKSKPANASKTQSRIARVTQARVTDAPRTQIALRMVGQKAIRSSGQIGVEAGSLRTPVSAPLVRVEWDTARIESVESKERTSKEATKEATASDASIRETSTPTSTTETRTRLAAAETVPPGGGGRPAQTPQTGANDPAAVPPENPPALQAPVTPDEGEQPEPAPAQPEDEETTPPPTTVTPAPTTPTTPDVAGEAALTPEQAQGREIAEVRIVGNRVVTNDTIFLTIAATRQGAAFSPNQAELDRRRIRALGFFAAVDFQVVPNLQDPNKVDVIFVVVENRVVTGFRIEGNKQVKTEDILKEMTTKTGTVLNTANVDQDVKKIQELYRREGFAALVTDVRQEDNGTVVFTVQEGTVSRVELQGLNKTKPGVVRSQILTKPGDPFNERRIQQDLNRIYDTGFFEDVSYKITDDADAPGALIVTIVMKERRTGQFSFGVGFDSRSKISGFVGVSESNFRGTGKNVSAQVELGSQRSFNLGYGDRFVGDKNASYSINIFNQTFFREPRSIERVLGVPTGDEETFDYEEQRTGARFNYTQPLDFERTKNILFGYRFERVRLFLRDDDGSVPIDLPEDSSGRTSALSVGFLRDKRDLKLDPSRGGRELLTLEQGLRGLGGTSNFTKVDLDLRRYFPLIGAPKRGELPRLVVAGRLVVGQTFGQLPAFEQYFIGGSDTVRGYDADEQFGDNQIFGNVELRFRLQRKLQLVAFADAGSAYGGDFSSSDSLDTLFGLGVGARLQTPIGPVRLDVAKGDRGGFKTHFGIGSTF